MSNNIHSRCTSLAYHTTASKRIDQIDTSEKDNIYKNFNYTNYFYSYILLLTTRIPIVSLYEYVREERIDSHQTEAEGQRFIINSCR